MLEQRLGSARVHAVHIVAKVPGALAAPLDAAKERNVISVVKKPSGARAGAVSETRVRRWRTLASMRSLHLSYAAMALVQEASHFSSMACFGSGASSSSLGSKIPPYLVAWEEAETRRWAVVVVAVAEAVGPGSARAAKLAWPSCVKAGMKRK